ncbi:alpha/beta hydrolase [Lutibacter profundi]|uniref:Alpha/beta hydrolase n=1 Tax=Lutibacter profundi TaxID=1622118 RepID=A0A109RNX1_9FLAO|nr:alpha/beta fold hydrolase [Lutibacter profundi]AMC11471.1 alpha/beta hydrolase [Lutibacter profundi]
MFFLYKKINVHYTSLGKGRVVVLLHGFLENSTMWTEIANNLSKQYRVICVDLLGHGKTENRGYIHTMEDQANMVKAVLAHLHLRKYILIGHSMGGYVSLAFTHLYPKSVKGLCLMNSSALPDTEEKKINRDRAIKAVKQNHKTFVKLAIPFLFSNKNSKIFTSEIQQITKEALKMLPQGIVASLEGMKIRRDYTSIYKINTFPIQLIIGKQDPALEYASLIKQTKNTKVNVVEFPDGHMSYIENKLEVTKALQNFVNLCY